MLSELLGIIKKAAMEAYDEASPNEIVLGKVISEEPLKIKVSEKVIIEGERIILLKNVKEHEIMAEVNHKTEGASCGDGYHSHGYSGEKKFIVKNGLKVDDEVVMIRCFQGQRFIVLEKIEKIGGD